MQPIGMIEGMSHFMAEDFQAGFAGSPFDFEHLASFQTMQARMSQIEGNGHAGESGRAKPLLRQPEIGAEAKSPPFKLLVQLSDIRFQGGTFNSEIQIAHPQIKQLLLGPVCPSRLSPPASRFFPSNAFLARGHYDKWHVWQTVTFSRVAAWTFCHLQKIRFKSKGIL
jgi:hypothetical protein